MYIFTWNNKIKSTEPPDSFEIQGFLSSVIIEKHLSTILSLRAISHIRLTRTKTGNRTLDLLFGTYPYPFRSVELHCKDIEFYVPDNWHWPLKPKAIHFSGGGFVSNNVNLENCLKSCQIPLKFV